MVGSTKKEAAAVVASVAAAAAALVAVVGSYWEPRMEWVSAVLLWHWEKKQKK